MANRGGSDIGCPVRQCDIPFLKGLILPVETVLVTAWGTGRLIINRNSFPDTDTAISG